MIRIQNSTIHLLHKNGYSVHSVGISFLLPKSCPIPQVSTSETCISKMLLADLVKICSIKRLELVTKRWFVDDLVISVVTVSTAPKHGWWLSLQWLRFAVKRRGLLGTTQNFKDICLNATRNPGHPTWSKELNKLNLVSLTFRSHYWESVRKIPTWVGSVSWGFSNLYNTWRWTAMYHKRLSGCRTATE